MSNLEQLHGNDLPQHQHQNQDLTPLMQEMLAQMVRMQVELNDLKMNTHTLPTQPATTFTTTTNHGISTRRTVLRRLVAGLVSGVGMLGVAATLPDTAAAKLNARTGRIGAIVTSVGDSTTNDLPSGQSKIGLLSLAGTGNVDLANERSTPQFETIAVLGIGSDTGIYGQGGSYGIHGFNYNGSNALGVFGEGTTGVYGSGLTGVSGNGSDIGVGGSGANIGVNGTGIIGVFANGTSMGVDASSSGNGLSNPALKATSTGSSGITAIFNNNSNDTTLLVSNAGTGSLFKAWAGIAARVEITNGGLIKANGGFQTGGADLAEFIPVTGKLEQGDVVEIDPDNAGYFRRCATSGSLAVAGVVSTRPGISLGAANPVDDEEKVGDARKPQLALAGRIPVKVTGEGGPIRPGDLLIASSKAGHCMRAPTPAVQGSVLGKALGHFESGEGIVEMLVMLR